MLKYFLLVFWLLGQWWRIFCLFSSSEADSKVFLTFTATVCNSEAYSEVFFAYLEAFVTFRPIFKRFFLIQRLPAAFRAILKRFLLVPWLSATLRPVVKHFGVILWLSAALSLCLKCFWSVPCLRATLRPNLKRFLLFPRLPSCDLFKNHVKSCVCRKRCKNLFWEAFENKKIFLIRIIPLRAAGEQKFPKIQTAEQKPTICSEDWPKN